MSTIGSIRHNTYAQYRLNNAVERLQNRDTDSNNKLSLAESGISIEKSDKFDLNSDNQIGKVETAIAIRAGVNKYLSEKALTTYDEDGDRMLSSEEVPITENTFDRVDRNDDGSIGEIEMMIGRRILVSQHVTQSIIDNKDTNENGVLESDELNISEENFQKLDLNQDESIQAEELNAVKRYAVNQHVVKGVFSAMDNDQDGLLSSEEFSIKEETFQRLDANEDGGLELQELHPLLHNKFSAYTSAQQSEDSNQSGLDVTT